MSRRLNSESFQMDLRSSPSQQHLNPSRSSSIDSHERVGELDGHQGQHINHNGQLQLEPRPHKLDLYSIPVFLLELLIICGLSYAAYFSHFQHEHEPKISGFYCDDTSYRQHYEETTLTRQFNGKEEELYVLLTILAVPIMLIIFCELVNSMFGALKFRQIRALCNCCKLHSITRRTIRFSGAYLLGFLIVMISCDILANTTGRLRPYFAQECSNAYQQCISMPSTPTTSGPIAPSSLVDMLQAQPSRQPPPSIIPASQSTSEASVPLAPSPPGLPISSFPTGETAPVNSMAEAPAQARTSRLINPRSIAGSAASLIVERHWISLAGKNLSQLCQFEGGDDNREAQAMAMSWPSSPAALFTYACLFISCYLCFVGTARPFRIITSVLVMTLLLVATLFNVQLVKDHYQHWDDVAAGSVLAVVVVVFVLMVYLNKFKDTHYYENQKLHKRKVYVYENYRGHQNGDLSMGNYNMDKTESTLPAGGQMNLQNGDVGGSITNNDLAMRYFQIPRANYRGAPRPLSSLNQIR